MYVDPTGEVAVAAIEAIQIVYPPMNSDNFKLSAAVVTAIGNSIVSKIANATANIPRTNIQPQSAFGIENNSYFLPTISSTNYSKLQFAEGTSNSKNNSNSNLSSNSGNISNPNDYDPRNQKNDNKKSQSNETRNNNSELPKGNFNTRSTVLKNLGKGYKYIRAELSEHGAHLHINKVRGGINRIKGSSFEIIKNQLPKGLSNNQKVIRAIKKLFN